MCEACRPSASASPKRWRESASEARPPVASRSCGASRGRGAGRPRTSRSTRGRPSRGRAAGRRARAGRARAHCRAARAARPAAGRRAPACRRSRSPPPASPTRPMARCGARDVPCGQSPKSRAVAAVSHHRPSDEEPRPRHYFCSPCVSAAPLNGSATYGNWLIGAVSPLSTPSPSGSLCPGGSRRPPAPRCRRRRR